MISDWTSERGLAAIKKMGWPEWDVPCGRVRLCQTTKYCLGVPVYPFSEEFVDPEVMRELMDTVPALALLQKHAREWLAERKMRVVLTWKGRWMPQGYDDDPIDWCELSARDVPSHDEIDLALIEAIEAIEAAEDDHATEREAKQRKSSHLTDRRTPRSPQNGPETA